MKQRKRNFIVLVPTKVQIGCAGIHVPDIYIFFIYMVCSLYGIYGIYIVYMVWYIFFIYMVCMIWYVYGMVCIIWYIASTYYGYSLSEVKDAMFKTP